jgi:hypothetical protein
VGIIAPSANHLVRLITNKGNDHAVEVEEEHQEMEAELDEGLLQILLDTAHLTSEMLTTNPLVDVELAENLGRVQKVLVVEDPKTRLVLISTHRRGGR